MKQFSQFLSEAASPKKEARLSEKDIREMYLLGKIFLEGTLVEKIDGSQSGKIVRRGANHLICVDENKKIFRLWITDAREVKEEVYEIGTCKYRKHAQQMVPGQPVKKFSGKIKIKSSYK